MKVSELKQLIREEIGKVLNKKILKHSINAYPKKHTGKQYTKLVIPSGESIEIIEHPFEKQPNDSLIKYKGQEFVVGRSSLENALRK